MSRLTRVFLLSAFMLGCLAGITAATDATKPTWLVVEEWIRTNDGSLPENYEELVALPSGYRRMVQAALPTHQKKKIMAGAMRKALENDTLTTEQRALVVRAITYVEDGPYGLGRPRTLTEEQTFQVLKRKMLSAGLVSRA